MSKKYSLDSFISDIDKIALLGRTIDLSEYGDCDEEYREMLLLAQLLAKVHCTPGGMEKIMAEMFSNVRKDGEIEEDELDMVAGGRYLNEMPDGKKNKE